MLAGEFWKVRLKKKSQQNQNLFQTEVNFTSVSGIYVNYLSVAIPPLNASLFKIALQVSSYFLIKNYTEASINSKPST